MFQEDQQNRPNKPGLKLTMWLPLLFALFLAGGMWIGMQMQASAPQVIIEPDREVAAKRISQGKIEELLRYIETRYVDDVNREEIIQEAIDNILNNLDPHSIYIPSEELESVNEDLEGNFNGIGVEFLPLEDTIVVVSALPGGPSEAVGIQAGDKIVEVEDSIVAGVKMSTRGIMRLLRGEKGSQVNIGIKRGNNPELIRFNVTRDKIPNHSVDVAYMLDDETGYIKIQRFSATTYEEFMKKLEDLVENKGMKDLVIDLRGNPGGLLQHATNILSQLFEDKNKLLVYTEGRIVNRNDYETTGRAFFNVDDIVVLINEGSASASEILAGAIQDHDRGIIVGRRSFGKGLVQEQYKLRDGSALRLTVARYYTPSGRSIQKSYADLEEYKNDWMDRYNSGELSSEKKVRVADSTKFYTSGGRVVFGGGGITPDIFVPLDTNTLNENYLKARQQVPQFVFRYLEEHRTEFDYTFQDYKNKFQVDDQLYKKFLDYVKEQGIDFDRKQLSKTEKDLRLLIKARFAKHLYHEEAFATIWNEGDPMVKKAKEILRSPKPLAIIKE